MLNTLHKSERLDKKKVIDKMFSGGARSFSVFPLRVVYLPVEELEAPVSILVSVSKRRFKRAVKRNRVKRQIREAYRKNKHGLLRVLRGGRQLAVLSLSFRPVSGFGGDRGKDEDCAGTYHGRRYWRCCRAESRRRCCVC